MLRTNVGERGLDHCFLNMLSSNELRIVVVTNLLPNKDLGSVFVLGLLYAMTWPCFSPETIRVLICPLLHVSNMNSSMQISACDCYSALGGACFAASFPKLSCAKHVFKIATFIIYSCQTQLGGGVLL